MASPARTDAGADGSVVKTKQVAVRVKGAQRTLVPGLGLAVTEAWRLGFTLRGPTGPSASP
jgi:hypothetical protein